MQNLIETLVRSSLLLALSGSVVLLLLRVGGCRSSKLSRIAWGFVLLQGLLCFPFVVEIPIWQTAPTIANAISTDPAVGHFVPAEQETPLRGSNPDSFAKADVSTNRTAAAVPVARSWVDWCKANASAGILTVWAGGIAGVFVLQVGLYLQVLRRLRQAKRPEEKFQREWEELLVESGIAPEKIRLLLLESGGPGLLRLPREYVVVVPETLWRDADRNVRLGVLRHEIAHYRHNDLAKSFVLRLIVLLHWFNPIAHLAVRRFEEAGEWRCDAEAFGRDEEGTVDFAKTLLLFRDTATVAAVCRSAFCGNNVINRAKRLIDHTQGKGDSTMKKTMILSCSAMLLCLGMFQIRLTAQTSPTPAEALETQPADVEMSALKAEEREWVEVFGKVILPEGTDSKRFSITFIGNSRTKAARSGQSGSSVNDDGSFRRELWVGYDYAAFLIDRDCEWTARPVFFSVGNEPPKEEIIIEPEKGSLIEGTLLDETTGKPISGMVVYMKQIAFRDGKSRIENDFSDSRSLRTDKEGHFKSRSMPGFFEITVDTAYIQDEAERKKYFLAFELEANTDAKPVLKIPTPFQGRVLDSKGRPVKDATVSIHSVGNQYTDWQYTNTDSNGVFKRRTAPKNALIEIKQYGKPREAYVGWVKDELKIAAAWDVHLEKCETATGRLLDAKTNEPLAETLLFYRYENPENPEQKEFLSSSVRTDKEGNFKIGDLVPGLVYRFFVVPGRNRVYGGGLYSPRVELPTLKCEATGKTTELGDWTVDLTKTVWDPEEKQRLEQSNAPK